MQKKIPAEQFLHLGLFCEEKNYLFYHNNWIPWIWASKPLPHTISFPKSCSFIQLQLALHLVNVAIKKKVQFLYLQLKKFNHHYLIKKKKDWKKVAASLKKTTLRQWYH